MQTETVDKQKATGDFCEKVFRYNNVYINGVESSGSDLARFCNDLKADRIKVKAIGAFIKAGVEQTLYVTTAE